MANYLTPASAFAALLTSFAVFAEPFPGDPIAGEKFAWEICVDCHDVAKGQYGISWEGARAFQDVADDPAMTFMALRVFLRSHHEVMPDLMLSDTEADDVISYILSLK